jgi:hypothetical protein
MPRKPPYTKSNHSPEAVKRRRGRPKGDAYNQAVADEIVERLSKGETLTSICKSKHMPDRTTVWDWEERHPEFDQRLRAARLKQADSLFDQLQDIADAPVPRTNRHAISQRHQQIDVRKFRVARLNRALYGDASQVKLSGDAQQPVAINTTARVDVSVLSDEEREQLRALGTKLAATKGRGL